MGEKMQKYKQHAANLELEKLRRRKLDGDVPGQMSHYLNNLNKDYNVLEMKVVDGNALNLNALSRSAIPYNPNNPFGPGPGGAHDPFASNIGASMGGGSGFAMPLKKKKDPVTVKDGITHIDIRPTVNYRMIEPMEDNDPTIALNKKID
jgi:hypothetical protein